MYIKHLYCMYNAYNTLIMYVYMALYLSFIKHTYINRYEFIMEYVYNNINCNMTE